MRQAVSINCASQQALAVDLQTGEQTGYSASRNEVPPPPRVHEAPRVLAVNTGNNSQCWGGRPSHRPNIINGHFLLCYRKARIVLCTRCGAYVSGGRPSHTLSAQCRAATDSQRPGFRVQRARLLCGGHPRSYVRLREKAEHPNWADVRGAVAAVPRGTSGPESQT